MNKRERRILELWALHQVLDPKQAKPGIITITREGFEAIFNEGYILGYEVALLPREENKED